MLHRVEVFYDSIGGVVGYQTKSLQLIAAGMEELREEQVAKQQVRSGSPLITFFLLTLPVT